MLKNSLLKMNLWEKLFIFMSSFLLCSVAYAQNGDMTNLNKNQGGNNSGGKVQIIGGYSLKYLKPPKGKSKSDNLYLISQSPSYNATKITKFFNNQYLVAIERPELQMGDLKTLESVGLSITANKSLASKALSKALTQYFPIDSSGDIYNFKDNKANKAKSKKDNNLAALNADSLTAPIQYNKDNQQYASDFIKYVTNQYNPTVRINFRKLAKDNETKGKLTKAFRSPDVQKYLYSIRRIAALNSVGTSNLYFLFDQRVPQSTKKLLKGLPTTAIDKQLPKSLQKKASPLALEQWIATHRLSAQKTEDGTTPWVKKIENASPATLQRETVYLLADIQQELFKQRLLYERLLATASVQQLQSSGALNIQLNQLERQICQAAPFKGTDACPPQQAPTNLGSTDSSSSS